ncbi:MAG: glutamate--cysteine ligase [Deltaproteobacteria bacterium]|nr:glutamate--cysteine ligase [Deltaproteobacteria bacterium]
MNGKFSKMVKLFSGKDTRQLLLNGKWGLEKEAIRVKGNGDLSLTPHPEITGEKIANPHVTTDFSESQMEFITPAFNSIEQTFSFLETIKDEVDKVISSELLWPHSMPGPLPDDELIPIARFGDTNDGKIKEIYRSGLALRYGKKVQMVSGIHYNFSFQDEFWEKLFKKFDIENGKQIFKNETYVSLVRNVLRYRWLLIYLFGASPVADESYYSVIKQKGSNCTAGNFSACTQKATSLRMSRFGYDNSSQNMFSVSYNSLDEYIRDIKSILSTKNDAYSKMGIYKDGKQIQLNANQIQLENEFYSPVRFKQIPYNGETQIQALENRGIDYLELRTFDLNPFEKNGISLEQLYFTQIFMLFCLFESSNYFTNHEVETMNLNAHKTALMGRTEGLMLNGKNNKLIPLQKWGSEIIDKLRVVARLLDNSIGNTMYEDSVESQYNKILNSDLLPSSQMIEEMKNKNETYLNFNLRMARENRSQRLSDHINR